MPEPSPPPPSRLLFPNPCSPALPSAPLFQDSDWLILLTGLGGEGAGRGGGRGQNQGKGTPSGPGPWGAGARPLPGGIRHHKLKVCKRAVSVEGAGKDPGVPSAPVRSRENGAKLAASWLCLCSWEPLLLAGACQSRKGQPELPDWWTARSQKGAGLAETQRGPEGLWPTPTGAWQGPSHGSEEEERRFQGRVGSGVAGLDFHFPFGSDPGIPLPEAGVAVPPAALELHTPRKTKGFGGRQEGREKGL